MELILVCFGVLPFLAGRTVFASAVTFACYFVYTVQQEHELTPKTVLLSRRRLTTRFEAPLAIAAV